MNRKHFQLLTADRNQKLNFFIFFQFSIDFSRHSSWGFICTWIESTFNCLLLIEIKSWIFSFFFNFRSIFLGILVEASFAHESKALSIVYCGSKSKVEFFHFLPRLTPWQFSIDFSRHSSWGFIRTWIKSTFNCLLRIEIKSWIFSFFAKANPLAIFDRFFSTF